MAPPLAGDMKAGFVGLVVAMVFLLLVVWSISAWSTARFRAHHPAPAATQQP